MILMHDSLQILECLKISILIKKMFEIHIKMLMMINFEKLKTLHWAKIQKQHNSSKRSSK